MAFVSHRSNASVYSISPPAASGLVNVKDVAWAGGARGDGATDDRVAVQAAFEYATANGMSVYFPTGTYILGRNSSIGGSFSFAGYSDLTIYGAGMGNTIIKMNSSEVFANPGNWRMFYVRDCTGIHFRDLTLDGAFPDGSDSGLVNEQTHLVQVGSATTSGTVTNVSFESCEFRNVRGDGIRHAGADGGGEVSQVSIENCRFTSCNRASIGVQRGVTKIRIVNNYLYGGSDQQIDFEPTGGTAAVGYFTITDNMIVHTSATVRSAVALSGNGANFPNDRSVFANNFVLGGSLYGLSLRGVLIQGNVITGHPTVAGSSVHFFRTCDDILINGNYILNETSGFDVSTSNACINIFLDAAVAPKRISITNNTLFQTAEGNPVNMVTCDSLDISHNRVVFNNSSTNTYFGILVRAASAAIGSVSVVNNEIIGNAAGGSLAVGVQLSATAAIARAKVAGNHGVGCVTGVSCSGAGGYTALPVITENVFTAATVAVAWSSAGYVIAGNTAGVAGILHVVCTGTPEGAITAPVGSFASRTDGGASTTLYVKTSGTGNTGWTAK